MSPDGAAVNNQHALVLKALLRILLFLTKELDKFSTSAGEKEVAQNNVR